MVDHILVEESEANALAVPVATQEIAGNHWPLYKDFLLAVEEGLVEGYEINHKFGHSDEIGTTLVPVASGAVYATPIVAETLELVSTDSADNQAGVGLRTITIEGLDADFAFQKVTANMHATDGTIGEEVAGYTWTRVFRMYGATSGTYASAVAGSHQGTITLRTSGGAGQNWAVLELHAAFPIGQSQIGVYTVPAGKVAYIGNIETETDSNKVVDIIGFKRENANNVTPPFSVMRAFATFTGVSDRQPLEHKTWRGPFPAYTDVGFMAARTSAGTSSVSVNFEILLVDV